MVLFSTKFVAYNVANGNKNPMNARLKKAAPNRAIAAKGVTFGIEKGKKRVAAVNTISKIETAIFCCFVISIFEFF
jgi:hypothetical protein